MEKRPALHTNISGKDFNDFYWLKKELIEFCKKHSIPTSGSKEILSKKIVHFLKTGEISHLHRVEPNKKKDALLLELDAKITSNYNSGEEVRAFFRKHIGEHFKFTVGFMKFCKSNPEKTFADAIEFWHNEQEKKKDPHYKKVIGKQFEYNQYIHDFMIDNQDRSLQDAITCWKERKSRRGSNIYSKIDLELLK